MENAYPAGIDIGSTTAKMVICDARGKKLFSRYRRHHAQAVGTVRAMLVEARQELGDCILDPAFTGSAGMGVAESYGFPFIQEVVASAKLIRQSWPDVRTLIEIGGEDSKIAFFDDPFQPDIRMNGNCAGGTGAARGPSSNRWPSSSTFRWTHSTDWREKAGWFIPLHPAAGCSQRRTFRRS